MKRYFAERFQDIADALPSASDETLIDIQREMERLLSETRSRLEKRPQGSKPVAVNPANVHSLNSAGNV